MSDTYQVGFIDHKVEKFVSEIAVSTRAKLSGILLLLAQYGPHLGMPYSKKIDTNLYEVRIRGKQEVRIFYTFSDRRIYLLHGIIKKTQKLPRKEIVIALKRKQLL